MLDLITLSASMAVQTELDEIRKENGEAMVPEQPQQTQGTETCNFYYCARLTARSFL